MADETEGDKDQKKDDESTAKPEDPDLKMIDALFRRVTEEFRESSDDLEIVEKRVMMAEQLRNTFLDYIKKH